MSHCDLTDEDIYRMANEQWEALPQETRTSAKSLELSTDLFILRDMERMAKATVRTVKTELLLWSQQVNLIYGNQARASNTVQRAGFDLATKKGAGLPEMVAGTTMASSQFEYVFKDRVISLGEQLDIPITGVHGGVWQVPLDS